MRRNWMVIGIISSGMLFAQKGTVLPGPATGIPQRILPANIKTPASTVVVNLEQPSSQIAPALKLKNELQLSIKSPLVIASMGESYAAGEGNPNHHSAAKSNVKWQPVGPIFDANGQLCTIG